MLSTTTIHIIAQTFTDKCFPIDADPTHTVGELKALILAGGKVRASGLEYKGHELHDSRRVDHYGLATNDVLNILLPSKLPKITIKLILEDGSAFDITVSSSITVAKLKEEIQIEEKIAVRHLKLVDNHGHEDEVVTLLELQDDKAISEYSLDGKNVLVNPVSAPSAIDILVLIDDPTDGAEGSRIWVEVMLDQTFASFRELLLDCHSCYRAEHSLILFGRELKDDEQTLGDLGFVERCTVHAVSTVQLSVTRLTGEDYTFVLKVTTSISEIRKLLREIDVDVGDRNNYVLSLDGVHTLQESCTLLDLNLYSVFHRGKLQGGTRTIREELLVGGDMVDSSLMPLEQSTPEEVEERGQYYEILGSVDEGIDSDERSDFQLFVEEQGQYDEILASVDESVDEVVDSDEHSDFQLFVGGEEVEERGHYDEIPASVDEVVDSDEHSDFQLFVGSEEVEERGQYDEILVSVDEVTDSDERSDFQLFIGAARWTCDTWARKDDYDMFVEVKVDGSREVHRTMSTKTPHWNEYLNISGYSSSTIRIEIKSVAHESSRSLSVVQVVTSLENLVECCIDGDLAALELTIAPFAIDQATVAGGLNGSGHFATDSSIGIIAVKLFRSSYNPPSFLQLILRDIRTLSIPQTRQRRRRILEEEKERGQIDSVISTLADDISNLSNSYIVRFERLGDLADLNNSIASVVKTLTHTPDSHPKMPALLLTFGRAYYARFERLGELADLEDSIVSWERAVTLTLDGHPEKPGLCTNLGVGYCSRFERLGELTDLENSIASIEKGLALTPDGHPDKLSILKILGASWLARFERLGELADLENSITRKEQALALTPNGHPDKPLYLTSLGVGRNARFKRLGELSDLENSIACFEQALALTSNRHPAKPPYFTNLGASYQARFERLGELADLENSIESHEHAVALTPDGHPDKPHRLSNLGGGYHERFGRLGELADLENSIESYEQAVTLTPNGHPNKPWCLSNLGAGRSTRFERLGELSDLENSIACCEQALALTPDGHIAKPYRLSNLGAGYHLRFERLGELVDLENSIARKEQALALTPDDHPDKPGAHTTLGDVYRTRFERLGELADIEHAIACHEQALSATPDGHSKMPIVLSNLAVSYGARFERLGKLADLENSITRFEQAVALTPDDHPDKPHRLSNLGSGYQQRFERLRELADIKNSIASIEKALTLTPDSHAQQSLLRFNLGLSHTSAWNHAHEDSHLQSALLNMQLTAQSPRVPPRISLRASRQWARLSLGSGDIPSALAAFRTAIEILPQVAWLGLEITSRQDWLAQEKPEELGCIAATCAIWLGRFEEAVELLDMARSVFWQQASLVRSGLQDLKADQPELAEELEAVSKKLDASSFSGLSATSETQSYERRLAYHRELVLRRETLIKEIRVLPGFEFFLKPTPFNRIRGAAAAGRVVIINISRLGADALIFDRTTPIRNVPLSKVDVANSFKHTGDTQLMQPSDYGTLDQDRSLTLSEVLDTLDVDTLDPCQETGLATSDGPVQRQERADVTEDRQSARALPRVWNNIIKPIFAAIGIPTQRIHDGVPANRIFWYLTGPLTFIPVHAAGPVSELVVSSYATTLSSLAEAQRRQAEATSGPPMLLAISQPDTPALSRIPHATDEVDSVMRTVSAAGWPKGKLRRFDSAQATVSQVSTALDTCSWVHFACHAMQDTRDGMESAIALHDGRLKLSVIAAKRLTCARFAFLSTCESASGLEDSPGEAIHLSAGMQFAGFYSVIATMWSIQDEDAPIVAQHTYAYLVRNGVDSIDLTEGAAALSHAVSQLRKDPTVTMKRWAPFVYYGV